MASWLESIFGNLPPPPARPTSRGALLGAGGYQQMPDTKSTIEDRRQDYPHAELMRDLPPSEYDPYGHYYSEEQKNSTVRPSDVDQLLYSPGYAGGWGDASSVAPYKPSFQQSWKPPVSPQAPYLDPKMGPQLPQNMPRAGSAAGPGDYTDSDIYSASYLPPIGAHLPIAPGDRGWTPLPSPSGPHNQGGDPNRPGYGPAAGMPMGALSGNWWGGQ
jgi:hypothetical protein